MTPHQKRVYDIIVAAARAGEVCPSDWAIGAQLGLTEAGVWHHMRALRMAGDLCSVRVRMGGNKWGRIVRVAALGIETAEPHIRLRRRELSTIDCAIRTLQRNERLVGKPVCRESYTAERGRRDRFCVGFKGRNLTESQVIALAADIERRRA